MKRVYAILLCITILFAVSVEAGAYYSDDLLEEKIEEEKKEDEKNKEDNKEEFKEINNTKASVALNSANFIYNYQLENPTFYWVVYDIDNDSKYNVKCIVNEDVYIIVPYNSGLFFERGYEGSNSYSYCDIYKNGVLFKDDSPIYGSTLIPGNSYNRCSTGLFNVDGTEYVEPTPDPTPNPTPLPEDPSISEDNISVSWNSVSENLISIEEQIKGLRQDVQQLRNTTFSVSVSSVPDFGDDASVSNNIISKPLSEYSTSESIALITLMLAFSALVVYIIHKSIYRWKR